MRALVACSVILLVADMFDVCCANTHRHHHHHVGHIRRHMNRRGKYLARLNHHRRRSYDYDDDDDVMARETDEMAAESINGLFGPRQFAPVRAHHRPVKPPTPLRGGSKHRHRYHHAAGVSKASQKTFTLELPEGCEAEPCQHDGDCYSDPSSPLGYACHCQPGYSGEFCEIGKLAVLNIADNDNDDDKCVDLTRYVVLRLQGHGNF